MKLRTLTSWTIALALAFAGSVAMAQDNVRISEFMAGNESIIADEDGDFSDWVELHNAGNAPVNLDGWYLTDNANSLRKWRIPSRTLAPGSYLLIWASDKQRAGVGPLHTNFRLSASGEFLGLVRPDGLTIADGYAPSFPVQASNVSYGYAFRAGVLDPAMRRYFVVPTPGSANSEAAVDQTPLIVSVTYSPNEPTDASAISVQATIFATAATVGSVTLTYRVGYSSETSLTMFDDGAHGDGSAGDAVYAASIPASASAPGDMVRWKVTATDTQNRSSKVPVFADPLNSPEYLGTVIADNVSSLLPIFRWFVASGSAAETDAGTRASVSFKGFFYDNVHVSLQGQTSRTFPKKSFKFDFNPGAHFLYDALKPKVEEFNLISSFADKSYVRIPLAWETYKNAGNVYNDAFPMHIRRNNAFFSVATFVEESDERYLERNGLEDEGALYKMDNPGVAGLVAVEKKNRTFEDNSDLVAFLAGLQPGVSGRESFIFDNVDLARTLNYLAATVLINDNDHVAKNFYLYRDSAGTREWSMLPWDKELTFGRHYTPQGSVVNDDIWADEDPYSHPLFGDRAHPKIDGPWNRIIDALYATPRVREMFVRRLRTLMDQELQPGSTPLAQRKFEIRINELKTQIAPDAALDVAAWGPPNYGEPQTMPFAADIIKNDFLVRRRSHLFGTHTASGLIPLSQSPSPILAFGATDPSPTSLDEDEEYIEIQNPSGAAVDISNWRLAGDVQHTFTPGTVIPSGGTLYATPDAKKFRERTNGPRGGQSLHVQGNYSGHQSSTCEPISLADPNGVIAASMCGCGPVIQADDDGASCVSTPVTLSGPPGVSGYAWSTGETTRSIVVSPSVDTTFALRTIDGSSCASALSQVARSVIPNLTGVTVDVSGKPAVCPECRSFQATANETGGGSIARQWGYRLRPSDPIVPIPGASGRTFTPRPEDFSADGEYTLLVTTTPRCGAPVITVADEVSVRKTPTLRLVPPRKTLDVPQSAPVGPVVALKDREEIRVLESSSAKPLPLPSAEPPTPVRHENNATVELAATKQIESSRPGALAPVPPIIAHVQESDSVKIRPVAKASKDSENSTIEVELTLSGKHSDSIRVSVAVSDDSADAASTDATQKESVRFAPGETSKTLTLTLEKRAPCAAPTDVTVSFSIESGRATMSEASLTVGTQSSAGCR